MAAQADGVTHLKVNCSADFARQLKESIANAVEKKYLLTNDKGKKRKIDQIEDPGTDLDFNWGFPKAKARFGGEKPTMAFNKFPFEIQRMICQYAIEDHETSNPSTGRVWPVHWAYPTKNEVKILGLDQRNTTPYVVMPTPHTTTQSLKMRQTHPLLKVNKYTREVAKEYYSILPIDTGGTESHFKIILRPTDVLHLVPGGLHLVNAGDIDNHTEMAVSTLPSAWDTTMFTTMFDPENNMEDEVDPTPIGQESVTHKKKVAKASGPFHTQKVTGVVDHRDVMQFFKKQGRAFPQTLAIDVGTLLDLWTGSLLEAITANSGLPGCGVKRVILTMPSQQWRTGAIFELGGIVPQLGVYDRATTETWSDQDIPYAGPINRKVTLHDEPLRCEVVRNHFSVGTFPPPTIIARVSDLRRRKLEEVYFEIVKRVPRLEIRVRQKIVADFLAKRDSPKDDVTLGIPAWYDARKLNSVWHWQDPAEIMLVDDAALAVIQRDVLPALTERGVELKYASVGGLISDTGTPVRIRKNLSEGQLMYHDSYQNTQRQLAASYARLPGSFRSMGAAVGTVGYQGKSTVLQLWKRQNQDWAVADQLNGMPSLWYPGGAPSYMYHLSIQTAEAPSYGNST